MEPLVILQIDGLDIAGLTQRNEQMPRAAVRQGNRHPHALHRAVGGDDRLGEGARHPVFLFDLTRVHRLGAACTRREEHDAQQDR